MATITKRTLKTGELVYDIRVKLSDEGSGRKLRKGMTWRPENGMSEKKADKEVILIADKYEQELQAAISGSIATPNPTGITFAKLAEEWREMIKNTCSLSYYVKTEEKGNISRYAYARDYHFYFKELTERLEKEFPSVFRYACDSSPINEVEGAVKAGLGSIGKNGLLINKRYGSYVFVAEFFSKLDINDPLFNGLEQKERGQVCRGCNACKNACPMNAFLDKTKCVSFINQKKVLDKGDIEIIKSAPLVWGCDICQEACPENKKADETEIPFFYNDLTPTLTEEKLNALIESGEFEKRAYAWRGQKVIRRNIRLKEEV